MKPGSTSVALGEVARFINGAAFKEADWSEGGHRIIRIQNLTDPSKPFNRTEKPVKADLYVSPGDLLVSWSATLGVFVWPGPDAAVLNQHIFRVIPDQKVIDQPYLRHMLQRAVIDMGRHTHGATMKHINRKEFLGTRIPLPPLEEQKRIAAILDKADELQTNRRAVIAHLDSLTQAIFLDMFGDPVEGTEIQFADLAERGRGTFSNGPFGSDLLTSELTDEGVPVVYIRDIRNGEYDRVSRVCVTPAKAAALDSCRVVPGDVLIAKVGDPPGVAALYPAGEPPAVITQDVVRIRPDTRVALPTFVVSFLNSRGGAHLMRQITVEATRARFGLRDLKALTLRIPPLDLQVRFSEAIDSLSRERSCALAHASGIDALFASLQQRAFRGEL